MDSLPDLNFEPCYYCLKLTSKTCSQCHGIFDCGSHSDTQEMVEHKKYCVPSRMVTRMDDDTGRLRTFATRDLKPGQVIFKEYPFIYGPSDNAYKANQIPTCLGCCKSGFKKMQSCSQCGWPVCSEKCSKVKQHAENECSYLKLKGIKYPKNIKLFREKYFLYKAIYVLRALLIRRIKPGKFDSFMNLAAITSEDSAPEAKTHDVFILKLLTETFRASDLISNEESISKIIDHLTLYGYRKPFSDIPERWKGQLEAVYHQTSEMPRSCFPNVNWSIGPGPDFVLQLTAASSITKSQELTLELCHDIYSLGSSLRQQFISNTTGFTCDCRRCVDPSELGSFISSVKCERCEKGYLVYKNPKNPKSKLICTEDNCGSVTSAIKVCKKVKELYDETMNQHSENVNLSRIKELEEQVKEIKEANFLHPNHFIIFRLTWNIVRQKIHYLDKFQSQELCSFFDQCDYLLEIEKCISPVNSQERAELYFYMGRILTEQLLNIGLSQLERKEALDLLDKIMDLFVESRKIFNCSQKAKDVNLVTGEMYRIMSIRKDANGTIRK